MAVFIVVIGVISGLCLFSTALLRWNEVRYRKKGLPPGTMGWPVFGETTEFLKQGPSFMKNQRARSFFFWALFTHLHMGFIFTGFLCFYLINLSQFSKYCFALTAAYCFLTTTCLKIENQPFLAIIFYT